MRARSPRPAGPVGPATWPTGRSQLWVPLIATCLLGCANLRRFGPLPDEVTACRQLSRQAAAAAEQGDWVSAKSLLQEAVDACPDDVDARRELARVLWRKGEPEAASVQIDAAVELAPSNASLIAESGQILLAQKETDRALKRARRAIGLDPQLAAAWALRGRVYRKLGDWEQAQADLCRALSYSPRSHELLQELADLQLQHGQPQRCLTTLQQLVDLYPAGEEPQAVLHLQANAYAAVNRRREALESLYAASRRGPPRADLLYQLAELELLLGRPQAARAAAEQALAVDAGHASSRALLSRLTAPTVPDSVRR